MSALQRGFSTQASAMLSSSARVFSEIFIYHHQSGSINGKIERHGTDMEDEYDDTSAETKTGV